MSKTDALNELGARVTKADVEAYTDVFYVDIEDGSLNGVNDHSQRTDPHDIAAITNYMGDKTAELKGVLDTKLDLDYPPYAAKINTAGDEFTGPVSINLMGDALVLNGVAGGKREIVGQTANIQRWGIALADQRAEIGGNAGSNFGILRYSDDGDLLGNPFGIDRKTGRVHVKRMQIADGPIIEAEGLDIRLQPERPTLDLGLGTMWLNSNTRVCTVPTVDVTNVYSMFNPSWAPTQFRHTWRTTYTFTWTNYDPGFNVGLGELSMELGADWSGDYFYFGDMYGESPFTMGTQYVWTWELSGWSPGETYSEYLVADYEITTASATVPVVENEWLVMVNPKLCVSKPDITRDFDIGVPAGGGGGGE
jgi:hypothetical protein